MAIITSNPFRNVVTMEEMFSNELPAEAQKPLSIDPPLSHISEGPPPSASSSSTFPAIDNITEIDRQMLEPRPMDPSGRGCCLLPPKSIQALPETLTSNCDDYIALLGPLNAKPTTNTVPRRPEVKKRVQAIATSVSSDESTSASSCPVLQDERWMDRFHDLMNFYEREGHFNVPSRDNNNTALYQWVKRQRHQYRRRKLGQHSSLTEERVGMLNKIGFVWNSHLSAWNDKFEELKDFKALHGHCFVPCNYNGSSKLSTWIKRQRRQYRNCMARKSSTLDAERIAKLEGLGLVWDYYGCKEPISSADAADGQSNKGHSRKK